MKKGRVLVCVLIVLPVVAWLAATFYVGLRAEQVVRDEVAKMDILPGQKNIVLNVVRYERGLFSSTAHTCLIIEGELAGMAKAGALSGKICSRSTIHHGPLAFTDEGLYLGLASTRDELDLSGLPPEGKALVGEAFQGKPPIVARSRYGFDGSVSTQAVLSPVNLASPMGSVVLEQLQLDVYRPDLHGYPVQSYLTLKGLAVDMPTARVGVKSLTGSVDVVSLLGDSLPLTDVNLTGKGVSYSEHDLSLLGFDFTLQGSSQEKGQTLSGTSALWMDKIVGARQPLAMDSVYLGVDYAGFDTQALVKMNALNNELDQLQANMLLGVLAKSDAADPQQMIARMTALVDEMMTVLSEQLLHPRDSELALTLLVENAGERQISLDSRARYLGLKGDNLPLAELQGLTEQQINQMLDISLTVDVNEEVIPPPLAMQLPGLEAQGLVVNEGTRWRGALNANGGELTLNGEAISAESLKKRLNSVAPGTPAGRAGAMGVGDGEARVDEGMLPGSG